MPGKNTIKTYQDHAYYHLYNRGVNKQLIFRDDQDYNVFLSYLKTYLELKDEKALQQVIANENAPWREKAQAIKLLRLNNFFGSIILVAYCLMPNHFHFLVKQTDADTIDRFMNSLCTRYTMYFNRKYKWVGTIFQSVYKAVQIISDDQLLYITRYIHRNPLIKYLASKGLPLRSWKKEKEVSSRLLSTYQYSSYPNYLGIRQADWVNPKEILDNFGTYKQTYQSFVEDTDQEENSVRLISKLSLDEI